MNINKIDYNSWASVLSDLENPSKELVLNRTSGELKLVDKTYKIEADSVSLNTEEIISITNNILMDENREGDKKALNKVFNHFIEIKDKNGALKTSNTFKQTIDSQNQEFLSYLDKEDIESFISLLESQPELASTKDSQGNTLLHLATEKKQFNLIPTLININISLDSVNNNGETPIDLWAKLNPSELTDILLSIASPDANGFKNLLIAAKDILIPTFKTLVNVKTKEDLLTNYYESLMNARYNHLIDPDRFTMPDVKARTELFIKRAKAAVEKEMKTFRLDEFKNSSSYETWIKYRRDLSTTVSGKKQNPPPDTEISQANANWLEADTFITDLAVNKKDLDIKTICQIHYTLGKGLPNNGGIAGELRTMDISNGDRSYIPGILVQNKMNEYITWFNTTMRSCREGNTPPIEFAALAYQRLVSIHPFSDANGRCCRMVMDYVLRSFGYPPALLTSNTVSVAVFGELMDDDMINCHPKKAIRSVYEGITNTIKSLKDGTFNSEGVTSG